MKYFLSLLFLVFYVVAQANITDNGFLSFNTGNGKLMHNTVESVYRDHTGYVWVGTNLGLNRLDGYKTVNFTYNENDSSSISGNFIKSVFVDSKNNVWVGTTGGGANRFIRSTNSFERFLPDSSSNSIGSVNVLSITEDEDGNIWFGNADKKVSKYLVDDKRFVNYDLSDHELVDRGLSNVNKVFSDTYGNIWAGMSRGEVFRINVKTEDVQLYSVPPGEAIEDIGAIMGVAQLDSMILFSTWSGKVYKIVLGKSQYLELLLGPETFNNSVASGVVVDRNKNLWVATRGNGLYRFDKNLNLIDHFVHDQSKPGTMATSAIVELHLDWENNLWLGYLDNGLGMKPIGEKAFSRILTDQKNKGFVNIYHIEEDREGNIWFATRGNGLWKYVPKTNEYKQYLSKDYPGLNSDNILCVVRGNDNKLLIGTDGSFLTIFDQLTESFEQVKHGTEDWSSAVFSVAENENHYWVVTWGGGVKKIAKSDLTYTSIDFDNTDQFNNSAFDIKRADSILWIANVGLGLIKYNINSEEYKIYSGNDGAFDFPRERINHINIENENSLWLSTDGGGIVKFIPSEEKAINISRQYGIQQKSIQSSAIDSKGVLWLTTLTGIVKVDTLANEIVSFGSYNGLIEGSFNQSAIYYDESKNLLYAGGVDGANCFNPSEVSVDTLVNKVVFTGIEVLGDYIEKPNFKNINRAIDVVDTIQLEYNENIFTIHFSSMDFTPTDKNRYYYKLEGFNPDWAVLHYSQNFVQYTNLNPGEYTFKVKACNSDGTCSDKISSITIIIHPEWWQTTVFIGFVIVFILLAIVLYTRMRQLRLMKAKKNLEMLVIKRTREILDQKQRIEQQNKELEKANRTKDKFLSVIGHDLRSPMTSIDQIIELILMRYNTVSDEEMRKFLELLQKTSASTLNLLDDLLLWAQAQSNQNLLQKENLSVDNLLHELINSISLIAEKKRIKIDVPLNTGIKILADRNSILTVLRNLLTNAIKFSHSDSTVSISIKEGEENVVFSVADKGIGISANRVSKLFQFGSLTSRNGTSGETGTGFGLTLCKEFVENNGGKIWVESEEGKGSVFSFTVNKA